MTDDDLRSLLQSAVAEMRRHFDVTAEAVDRKISSVSESAVMLAETLDRRAGEIEQKMDRGFSETQAMIKFSHAELDRRLTKLEHAFGELQARVERLESTTH